MAQVQAQPTPAAGGGSLPEGVTAADVKDPDNIENLVCVSVLEKKVEEFNGKMQAALRAGKRDQMKAW